MNKENHNCDILICYHNNTKGLCCLYNPDNCKYRQLQKENVDLEEKISVLLSCKNCPENKGGLICQKEYENKCLAQKIQHIKELQEENAELKVQLENDRDLPTIAYMQGAEKQKKKDEEQLTKAKICLEQLVSEITVGELEVDPNILQQAEQFLSEVENDNL